MAGKETRGEEMEEVRELLRIKYESFFPYCSCKDQPLPQKGGRPPRERESLRLDQTLQLLLKHVKTQENIQTPPWRF